MMTATLTDIAAGLGRARVTREAEVDGVGICPRSFRRWCAGTRCIPITILPRVITLASRVSGAAIFQTTVDGEELVVMRRKDFETLTKQPSSWPAGKLTHKQRIALARHRN